MSNDSLKQEFLALNDIDPDESPLNERFCTATNFINERKNRYTNILANETTRVLLNNSKHPKEYINANYVLSDYIATQAPLGGKNSIYNDTMFDFWLMVLQQNCNVIVMLANLVENGKKKADRYWPKKERELNFKNICVKNIKFISLKNIDISTLEITLKGKSKPKLVYHIHYKNWPDMNIPENTEDFMNLISLVDLYNTLNPTPNGKIISHCSAGIGRTGTFIAIHHIITLLKNGTKIDDINILDVVKQMRICRYGMIQTVEQYKFVHEVIYDWLDEQLRITSSKRRRLSRCKSLCVLPSYFMINNDDRNMLTVSQGILQIN